MIQTENVQNPNISTFQINLWNFITFLQVLWRQTQVKCLWFNTKTQTTSRVVIFSFFHHDIVFLKIWNILKDLHLANFWHNINQPQPKKAETNGGKITIEIQPNFGHENTHIIKGNYENWFLFTVWTFFRTSQGDFAQISLDITMLVQTVKENIF